MCQLTGAAIAVADGGVVQRALWGELSYMKRAGLMRVDYQRGWVLEVEGR